MKQELQCRSPKKSVLEFLNFSSPEERGYRERWSPFKGEGDEECSK